MLQQRIDAVFGRLREEPPTRLSITSEPSLRTALLPNEICVVEQALTGRSAANSSAVCSATSCMTKLFKNCGGSGGGLNFTLRPSLFSRYEAVAPSSLADSHLAGVADRSKHIIFVGDSIVESISVSAECEVRRAAAASRQHGAKHKRAQISYLEMTSGTNAEHTNLQQALGRMRASGGGLAVAAIGAHFGDDEQMRAYFVARN